MYVVRHASKAEERKDHKYVARVSLKKRTNKRKYRYFYDLDKYKAYLKGLKEIGNVKTSISEPITDANSNVKDAKDRVEKASREVKKVKNTAELLVNRFKNIKMSDLSQKRNDKKTSVIDKFLDKTIGEILEKIRDGDRKEHKYIEKVKLPNGKYRYFYKQEEYDAYLKRSKYQKDEPDFMKDVPEISPNTVMSQEEDMAEINEKKRTFNDYISELAEKYDTHMLIVDKLSEEERTKYWEYYDDWQGYSMNCNYCTTAYELRRRGYDVEAAPTKNGADFWDMYNWYEDAQMYYIKPDGSSLSLNNYIAMGKEEGWDKYTKDVNLDNYDSIKYDSSTVAKTIAAKSGKNTRGNLCVYYYGGGGHSMAYEVDGDGKVTIRDCQINETVPLSQLTNMCWNFNFMRTDNLTVSESILETVYNNKTEKSLEELLWN